MIMKLRINMIMRLRINMIMKLRINMIMRLRINMIMIMTDTLIGLTIRRLAAAKLEASISDKQLEVQLSAETVESLGFLLWRHLEHYLLFSNAALSSSPATPYQVDIF